MTDVADTLTIPITDGAPVRIVESDWPLVAQASGEWHDPDEYDSRKREYELSVRQHEDGRMIVYAKLDPPKAGQPGRAGLVDPPEDLTETVRKVGRDVGLPNHAIQECLADLPPVELS